MRNDVGELFQRTLPDVEPKVAYSADETVTSGRRRRNRVRVAAAGGGGLAVVAAAAVSLALLPGAASTAPPDDGGERKQQAAKEKDSSKDERDELAREIAGFISVGLESGTVAPHSSKDFELGWFDDATGDWETGDSDHFELRTFVYGEDEAFGGVVSVALYAPGSFHDKPMEVEAGQDPEGTLIYCAKTECVKSTTDDGDTLYEQEGVSGQRGISTDHALEVREDGTAVLVSSVCGDLGPGQGGKQLNCGQPLLTVAELSEIAGLVPDVTEVFED